jgi:lipopolysaccharide/colanic/teichoic acid biosynthesis glycosyltransferase
VRPAQALVKRSFDIIVSGFGLILLLPVGLAIGDCRAHQG